MRRTLFTPDDPPTSGRVLRVWRWVTVNAIHNKPCNIVPTMLITIRAGYLQKQAGAAQYEVVIDHTSYYIHDADDSITKLPNPKRTDNFYYL